MTTAIPTVEAAEAQATVTPPAAASNGTVRRIYQYSEYVDAGAGAVECEHARDGQCEDIEHFHAWCRLPNPYQHQDIRAKGMAAKARRIRRLKDPESDESVVLDQELSRIEDPAFKSAVVDELVGADWAEDYMEAQRDVEEREEFEHITQDREEFKRLDARDGDLPEAEQSEDYKRLKAHMDKYLAALSARLEQIQAPKRAEHEARPVQALVEAVRTRRLEEDSDRAFMETYNAWTWFVGTFHVELHKTLRRPHRPRWEEMGHADRGEVGTMYGESPEVLDAIRSTFTELQLALQRGSAGN